MTKQDLAASDLLYILAPPISLVDLLEAAFEAGGEKVPASYRDWLERWKAIRGDEAHEIDQIRTEQWKALAKIVRERVAV